MASSSVTTPESTRRTSRDLAGRGFAAILFAIVAVAVGRGIAGAVVTIPNSFRPLSWSELVGVATLAGICASVAFSLLARWTARPERWFVALAGTVLMGSFVPLAVVGPTVSGATTELLAVLAAMHVAVAAGVTLPLVGWPGPRSQVEAASIEE
ncbi:DUF6069 family protein [Halomarina salina]|uniref:DUF6069 family protein n=1 Tax=Halomarina salina TaxID=1872699 RepID=A0ABD5RNC7_9EURY|nr:DUF6069 family protein [Halomarina salina]